MNAVIYKCAECGQVIGTADQPKVLTAFGWCHPVCAPEGEVLA